MNIFWECILYILCENCSKHFYHSRLLKLKKHRIRLPSWLFGSEPGRNDPYRTGDPNRTGDPDPLPLLQRIAILTHNVWSMLRPLSCNEPNYAIFCIILSYCCEKQNIVFLVAFSHQTKLNFRENKKTTI